MPALNARGQALASSISIDTLISTVVNTVFSPFWSIMVSIMFYAQHGHKDLSKMYWNLVWTGIVCLMSLIRHLDRVYASGGTWWISPPKLDWGEQIVLITGGRSGIGALLAETLAFRNVTVVILTKDEPEFEQLNQNAHTYICDVSDYDQVERVAARIRKEVGEPTILVNNAGVVKGKLLLDLIKEDVEDTFGANTLAHFWVLKAFLPSLLRQKSGHIVSMGSILGLVGAAQMTDYCASKAALVSLHQTLRFELDNRYHVPEIRTTLVLPSFTHTTLFDRAKLPSSWLFNFLAPPLYPHTVVKHMIDALDAQESRIIRLPWYSNLARVMGPGLGFMPRWLTDLLQWMSGADFAMKEYGPHPDAAERLKAVSEEHERAKDL